MSEAGDFHARGPERLSLSQDRWLKVRGVWSMSKVCPLKVDGSADDKFSKIAYAVKNKDNDERARSSSGAVFIEVAKAVLGSDGIVYGVRLDDEHRAMHDRADSIESVRKFQAQNTFKVLRVISLKMLNAI